MKLAYYPGCSGLGSSKDYDVSTRAVCKALGLKFEDINDFSCCGSTPAHAMDHTLSSALSARNLRLAVEQNADTVTTPCPSCLANLKTAKHRMADPAFKAKVDNLLDSPIKELPEVYSTLQLFIENVGLEAIKEKVRKPLSNIKVACYYGCLLSRPKEIMQFDNPENPTCMDKIMEALGADVVDFPLKTECCGAADGIPLRKMTANLSARILERAKMFGADMVVVACPLCQMNLDLRQKQANKKGEEPFDIPVMYFTQAMGLAFGLNPEDILLDKLVTNPSAILYKIVEASTNPKGGKE